MTANLAGMSEREYFAHVAKRLGVFVVGSRLTGVEGFLDGYDQHALRHGGPGLSGRREWLVARQGQDCNHIRPRDTVPRVRGHAGAILPCPDIGDSWPSEGGAAR